MSSSSRTNTQLPHLETNLRHRKRNEQRKNSPTQLAKKVPKKILKWLYSFSFVILMFVMLGFVLITPLDIILQTVSKRYAAIKLFIIIAACAAFVLLSLLFYFSRLYRRRVMYNQVPSKSLYLPLEKNDLPPSVLKYIMDTLQRCVGEIKVKAGPLANEKELFNYPGRVAPLYIQRRNIELGFQRDFYLLPEDHSYQDIIDSIGLKLRLDGLFANTYTVPRELTFREIFISVLPIYNDNNEIPEDLANSVNRCVLTYEKAKFSGQLLELEEIVDFFIDLEKVVTHFFSSVPLEGLENSQASQTSDLDVNNYSDQNSEARMSRQDSVPLINLDTDDARSGMASQWNRRAGSGIDSIDILPFVPTALNLELAKSSSGLKSMYSQVESNYSLTNSVLRAPAPTQVRSSRARSLSQWEFLNPSHRFSSK